jgi:hypothetical protein
MLEVMSLLRLLVIAVPVEDCCRARCRQIADSKTTKELVCDEIRRERYKIEAKYFLE